MHYLEYGLPVMALIALAIVAKGRFDHARRRQKKRRAQRYWAAYEAAWAIVHGRRRFKRLPFYEAGDDPGE